MSHTRRRITEQQAGLTPENRYFVTALRARNGAIICIIGTDVTAFQENTREHYEAVFTQPFTVAADDTACARRQAMMT
jgi:hypothetical protein